MKSVLIVDDERSFLLSLQDGLSPHRDNFEVFVAADGGEAVEILRRRKIDLLVTDLKLPVLDGFELLAWVSRHCPKMAVIVMTAFGTPEIESRLARMESLQYLEKPLDLDVLEQSIFTALTTGSKSYIRGITLPTFLQLVRMEQKNCTVKITSTDRVGYLFLRRGELLDAETGELRGEQAAYEIFSWDDSEIEMDGICRRQDVVIEASLEHVLMEAFRLKDERDHAQQEAAQKIGPDPSVPRHDRAQGAAQKSSLGHVERERRERLLEYLQESRDVLEYALFDEKGFLEKKSTGKNSLLKIDPEPYLAQFSELSDLMAFGTLRFFSLYTKSRTRYLLFGTGKSRVFLRLKPGVRAARVHTNVQRFVNL